MHVETWKRIFVSSVILALCAGACSDDPPVPETDSFVLKATFVDQQGDPVSGLQISAFNRLPVDIQPDGPAGCGVGPPGSSRFTSIRFDVPTPGRITMVVRNLRDEHVRTLADQALAAGTHQLVWDRRDDSGEVISNGVYRFRLTGREGDSSAVTFEAEVLGLAISGAPAAGATDENGAFTTTDVLQFPGVVGVEELTPVGPSGTLGEAFVLESAAALVARSADGTLVQCFEAAITNGVNDLVFTWDPTAAGAVREVAGAPAVPTLKTYDPVPGAWRLYPNTPNPF